jgi:hypothetical protein
VGDFNGDGIPDLATTNYDSRTVTVLLGAGDGTFTPSPQSIPTGSAPYAIAAGDFSGNGILDLAELNDFSSDVWILIGDGAGNFSQGGKPTTGTYPSSITVGDFNGDGIPDLAANNGGWPNPDGTATVLLGNGNGTFTGTAVSPPVGNSSGFITSGDFKGDGISDLAVANAGDNTLTVLLAVNGTAAATATAVSVPGTGTHQIVASYSGDSNYKPSVSQPSALTAGSGGASAPAVAPESREKPVNQKP